MPPLPYETIEYEYSPDHVATITINRPGSLNAFSQQMCDEFREAWKAVRDDDEVHAVVLRAAGERAFSTGVDRKIGLYHPENFWNMEDPGNALGPKRNKVWKPVVCAIQGMAAGGAFYWINESDIIICSEDATFFDPHVSYGMTSALEPMGLLRRIPLGEVLRWALMGLDERMTARRALEIGLVSEVVEFSKLHERAHVLAAKIAAKPSTATQGTVKAIWDSLEMSLSAAQLVGLSYPQLGNPTGRAQVDPEFFSSGKRPDWEAR